MATSNSKVVLLRSYRHPTSQELERGLRPVARPEMFRGLLGEYADAWAPYLEVDKITVLAHALPGFGIAVGRDVTFRVARTDHFLNLHGIIIADTGIGKGQAGDVGFDIFKAKDGTPLFPIRGGIASGEGLINAVADPEVHVAKSGKTKALPGGGSVPAGKVSVRSGTIDKRLLVFETEFGGFLTAMAREGSTLDVVVRQTWDGRPVLEVITKHNVLRATGAHVGILGHSTPKELLTRLPALAKQNGTGNRFFFIRIYPVRELPEGASLEEKAQRKFREAMRKAVEHARSLGPMDLSDPATMALWAQYYHELRQPIPGEVGPMVSRGAPMVRRLACLYAALDGTAVLRPEHLQAARAFWDYSVASVSSLFEVTVADQYAQRILAALQVAGTKGMTQSEIRRVVFSNHVDKSHFETALTALLERRQAVSRKEPSVGTTKPTVRWRVTRVEEDEK